MADSFRPERPGSSIDPAAHAALKGLLGNHWLYLKSDDRLIRTFHAFVRIGFKIRDGRTNGTSYIVHRNDERVVVIALSEQGLPFCYMSNDLLVAFDPKTRGRLLIRERGNPSFVLGADSHTTGLRCEVSYETRAESHYVMLDIAGILRSAVENLTSASGSPDKSSIDFATSRATGSIELQSDDEAAPPLRSLAVLDGNGSSLALNLMGPASVRNTYLSRTTLEQAGIALTTVTSEKADSLSVFAPPDLGSRSTERSASERLQAILFPPR